MKRVLVYSPDPLDGVSFMRQWGPLGALEIEGKISAHPFSNKLDEYTHWTWFTRYHVCLLSRPHRYNDLVFAEQCKKHGLRLWVDLDDTLHHITADNPVYELFAGERTKSYIDGVIKMADVVSVSSKLYADYLKTNLGIKNIVMLPNALDERLLQYEKPYRYRTFKTVSYRGSQSHMADIAFYADEIAKTMDNHQKSEFYYYGINPFLITQKTSHKMWAYTKMQNILDYYAAISKTNANIHFTPLIGNYFNTVKSHLSWIDGTLAGSACLVPDMAEWKVPGVEHYNPVEKQSFLFHFGKMMEYSDNKLENMHKLSREWQKDNILLSKINNIRMELING